MTSPSPRPRTRTLVVGVLALASLGGGAGITLAASAAAGSTRITAAAEVAAPAAATAADPALAARLAFNREEERLARDLYQYFSDTYAGARPFSMIVRSEQQHFDAIGRLLATYGIADPSAGRAAGSYADPGLQQLYDTWKARGSASSLAAAQVGVELENRDISDLEKAIAASTQADVKAVLGRLLAGSRNHLRAFTAAAAGQTTGTADGSCDGTGSGAGAATGQGRGPGSGMGSGMGAGMGPGMGTGMGNGAGLGNGGRAGRA